MDRQPGPGNIAVANETTSTLTRFTRGGKQLRYDLRIIQQPERARACGAGAKASADRRPVDPPPILQLQITEVGPNGEQHDVTFTMHANYFAFATLERGRHTAQARGVQDNKNMDVLTGTNVVGMQPFDRPVPAIYFIFPDLSVRHEGRYRLLFSLYEDCRRPEDEDRTEMPSSMPTERHITYRMDVRSTPFDVYSAKRFPGLTESTNLSRTFAEQGSRIRIRRDVRMRRRDNKSGKDWDEYGEEDSQLPRLSQTPDPYSAHAQMQQRQSIDQRPRSSNSQMMQQGPRRPSVHDMNQYQAQAQAQQSGFAFPHAYSQPTQPYTQASVLHPPPAHMPTTTYQSSSGLMPAPSQNYYSYGAQQPVSYPAISTDFSYQPRSGEYSATLSADSRRTSMQSLIPQNQQMYTPQSTVLPTFQRQIPQEQIHHQHHSSIDRGHAPPEPIQPPTRTTTPNPPSLSSKSTFSTTLPPLSTGFSNKLEAASPSTAISNNYANALPVPAESHKRPYGSTFSTLWQDNANKQGARPNEPASMFLAADADGDDTADLGDAAYLRVYRRAGGHTVQRSMP